MAITITPAMVKELRIKTDAGMLDCKNALIEADGDQSKAEKVLKEKGLASAVKRADRDMSEGKIFCITEKDKMVILELTCETDFVAKTDQFIELGNSAGRMIAEAGEVSADLDRMIKEQTAILKENMTIKRFEIVIINSKKAVSFYSHNDGQIGVIVEAEVGTDYFQNTAVLAFLRDCAMHVAALNPLYLSRDKVDGSYLVEQEEILTKQTEALGKPAEMAKNIAKGKLNKHIAEICLIDQPFVKDPSMTVAKKAEEVAKAVGTTIIITNFISFRVGA